jgi:hypothetical protein
MRVTQDLNSFGGIIAYAQCSVDENKYIFRVYHKNNCKKKIGSPARNRTNPQKTFVRNGAWIMSSMILQHIDVNDIGL